jgi:hypothetical protein
MQPFPQYIKQDNIDKEKWDRCIDHSANSLIYAQSFFLDEMAGDWDALITGDYQQVMPLTWRKKWGMRYLYQPSFTQQLGIFSLTPVNSETIEAFVAALKREFSFAEIFLNYLNEGPFAPQPNFILSLNDAYENICAQYNEELVRNLQYAQRYELRYGKTQDFKSVISNYRELYGDRTPHVDDEDYGRFASLCSELESRSQLVVREVKGANSEQLAMAVFARDRERLYYLLPVTLPNGRTLQANHFLVDQAIREFCGQKLILDFEGSTLPGVARFYKKFGATDQPFYFLKHNKLPPPFSWFKS